MRRPLPLRWARLNFACLSGVTFLALSVIWFSSAWSAPSVRWVGIGGDAPDFIWYLAWMPWVVLHLGNPLFTRLINYPQGVNLAWDTSAPLLTLLAAPITLVAGPVVAYNAVMTMGVASSAWAVALVTRRWVVCPLAAFFAGLLFLISPDVVGQALEHPFMIFVPFIPLTILWFDWAVVRKGVSARRAGVSLAVLVVAEFYCSEELAADLVFLLVIGVLCVWALSGFRVDAEARFVGRASAIALLLGAAGTAPFLAWQVLGPSSIHGAIIPPENFSARLLAYVVPGPLQMASWSTGYRLIEGAWFNLFDFGTYLGVPALVLIGGLAWRRRRQPLVQALVCVLGIVMLLSLGGVLHVTGRATGIPLPGRLLLEAPVLRTLLPVRLAVFADVLAAVLLGLAIDQFWLSRGRAVAVLAALVVVASWIPVMPFPATALATPPYFSRDPSRLAGERLLIVPFSQNWSTSQPMEWQAEAKMSFAMVDGYYTRVSGVWPSGATRLYYHGPPLNPLTWDLWTLEHQNRPPEGLTRRQLGFRPMASWRGPLAEPIGRAVVVVSGALRRYVGTYLDLHRVTAVVLGPTSGEREIRIFLTRLLNESPRLEAGVFVWERPRRGEWQDLVR